MKHGKCAKIHYPHLGSGDRNSKACIDGNQNEMYQRRKRNIGDKCQGNKAVCPPEISVNCKAPFRVAQYGSHTVSDYSTRLKSGICYP
jgi:hypothetical protein